MLFNKKHQILIVDDGVANIDVLVSLLKSDYFLTVARSGEKALKLINKRQPDLILLDIVMPDMDGYEVCRTLKTKKETKNIPVIFITSRDNDKDEAKGLELGAVDYIRKPFNAKIIKSRLKTHLDLKTHRDHLNELVTERTEQLSKAIEQLKGEVRIRRKAEREALEAWQAAEVASQAKSAFLANMSHEMRTPLNGILGFQRFLLNTSLSNQQREYAHSVLHSACRLEKLISNILDISKIEAGEINLHPEIFSIHEVFDELTYMMEGSAKDKGLKLEYIIHDAIPEKVYGDVIRVKQVLHNLVDNAIKFTYQGKIIISASLEQYLESSIKIKFTVSDTGIGIPEEHEPEIFQRFTRVDISMNRKNQGTGIGLAIAKEFTSLLGGEIGVESESDKGSMFWFTAEFPKTIPVSIHDINKGVSVKTYPENKMSQLQILVAEDDLINQRLIERMLKKADHNVDIANNGMEAVNKFCTAKERYDIILMDIQMPEMDGYEATRKIRGNGGNNIPIIAVTAHAMKGDREKCLEAGMDDYLTKPVDRNILLANISKNIKLKSDY